MAAGKRKDGESFSNYRSRLNDKAKADALGKNGSLIWPAYNGSYIRSKHGPIGSKQ